MSEQFQLDTRGLLCPEPVMLLHKKMREIALGDELLVLATDPSTARDIPKFCLFLGHVLLAQDIVADEFHYRIQKSA